MQIGDLELSLRLGLSPEAVLSSFISTSPPPLPNLLVSRASIHGSIESRLNEKRVLAVFGYPECGKTTAIAEFCQASQNVFWFSGSSGSENPGTWFALFLIALGQRLNATGFGLSQVVGAIDEFREPLDIVFDDAHRCGSLSSLKPILEAIGRKDNVRLLFIGLDDPKFLLAVRVASIADWRLPGLCQAEALALVESRIGDLSEFQETAVSQLRLQTDGHVGLIRSTTEIIQRIQTAADAESLRKQYTNCVGFAAMKARIIERIRDALSAEELELARRVAICVVAFNHRIAAAMSENETHFDKAWAGCITSVFESSQPERFRIPEIYRDGFEGELGVGLKRQLHLIAASAFGQVIEGAIELNDIYASIVHSILAEDVEAAVESAAVWIESAPDNLCARYLFELLRPWLWDGAGEAKMETQVVWLTAVAGVLGESQENRLLEASLYRLELALEELGFPQFSSGHDAEVLDGTGDDRLAQDVRVLLSDERFFLPSTSGLYSSLHIMDRSLESDESDKDEAGDDSFGAGVDLDDGDQGKDATVPDAGGGAGVPYSGDAAPSSLASAYVIGWSRLLLHGSRAGNVMLATTAVNRLRGIRSRRSSIEVAALWAYLNADENPLSYLGQLLERKGLCLLYTSPSPRD